MDKKTIVGLILMGAIFVGFVLYNNKQAEKYNEWRREQQIEQQKQAAEAEAERLAQAASEAQDTRSEEEKAAYEAALKEQDGGAGVVEIGQARTRALDEFEFYVQDGRVFLPFDKYEAAFGAYGGFVVELPAALKEF